jgi:hypothetical protein
MTGLKVNIVVAEHHLYKMENIVFWLAETALQQIHAQKIKSVFTQVMDMVSVYVLEDIQWMPLDSAEILMSVLKLKIGLFVELTLNVLTCLVLINVCAYPDTQETQDKGVVESKLNVEVKTAVHKIWNVLKVNASVWLHMF